MATTTLPGQLGDMCSLPCGCREEVPQRQCELILSDLETEVTIRCPKTGPLLEAPWRAYRLGIAIPHATSVPGSQSLPTSRPWRALFLLCARCHGSPF